MHIRAKKSLGQNFLINPHIIDRIISASEITKNDIIIEVGPGTGNLTKKLAEQAGRVIAIEKDHRLIEPLRETFKAYPNVAIIEGDILELEIEKIFENCKLKTTEQSRAVAFMAIENCHYKVVANIPYYITSHFIKTIFEKWPRPELIVLTIQKEVGERMTAKPPHMNLLALSVQLFAEPEIVLNISKNNFRPVPKVDSAIIKLVPKAFAEVQPRQGEQKLFELIKMGFLEKRKQLASTLAKRLKLKKEIVIVALTKIGVKSDIRPENLTLEQWIQLKKYLNI